MIRNFCFIIMPSLNQQPLHEVGQQRDTGADSAKPASHPLTTDREGAGHFSGLTIHGKGIDFSFVVGIQNPNRKQNILCFIMLDVQLTALGDHRMVAKQRILQFVIHGLVYTLPNPIFTLVSRNIVFVG